MEEKLFLGNVDRLDRKFWSVLAAVLDSFLLILFTEWRAFVSFGDSGAWFMDVPLPIYTGILDLEFLRLFSGDVGEANIFWSRFFCLLQSNIPFLSDLVIIGLLSQISAIWLEIGASDFGDRDRLCAPTYSAALAIENPAPKQTECLLFVDPADILLLRRSPIIASDTGDL